MPSDADKIALLLKQKYPDINPLTVQPDELKTYVEGLDGLAAKKRKPTEQQLESIQMAWLEEIAEK